MRRRLGKTTNPKLPQDVSYKLENMVRQMPTQKVRRRLGKWQVKSQRKRQAQVGKAGVAKINAERKAQAGEDGEQEVRRRLEKIVWQRPTRT